MVISAFVGKSEEKLMKADQKKALESAGWKVGDAADFLEMSDEERQLLDARAGIALAIRRQRKAMQLSQADLGIRLNTSQSRVAKIEHAASDVSFDQLLRAFAATGGKIVLGSANETVTKKAPSRGKKVAKRKVSSSDRLVLELKSSV